MRKLMIRSLVMVIVLAWALPATAQTKKEKLDAVLKIYKERKKLENHVKAGEMFAKLAAEYPDDRDIQLHCARTAYYAAHRVKKKQKRKVAGRGVVCAQRILDKNKQDYDGKFWKMMCTFKQRASEGIIAALKSAKRIKKEMEQLIKLDPNRFEGYMMLGTVLREAPGTISFGDKKKGLKMLQKAEKLAPKNPEMLLELAACYAAVGDKDMARKAYDRCINDSVAPKYYEWETWDARRYAKIMKKKL